MGVVDTGVVLSALDPQHRSHLQAVRLFDSSARGRATLYMSAVNVAEVLEQAEAGVRATGLDPVAYLDALNVNVHSPTVDVARLVAALRAPGLSPADRFAAATAQVLGARLHTTHAPLAAALRARRLPVTVY